MPAPGAPDSMLVRLERQEAALYFGIGGRDQTSAGLSESAIGMVVRKPVRDEPGPLSGFDLSDEDREALKEANCGTT